MPPQGDPWDRYDSREGHAQGKPGAGCERKVDTLPGRVTRGWGA